MEEDEVKLWKEYATTKDIDIRNQLVEKYAPLVKYVAGNLFQSMPKSVEFDDLVSAGIFGLFDAIEKFDVDVKVKFKTYAITRIQGAIRDELRAHDPLPRSVRQKIREIELVTNSLQAQLGRAPRTQEILDEMSISEEQYDKIMTYVSQAYVLSLNNVLFSNSDGEQITYFDQIGTALDDSPQEAFAQKDLVRVLKKAIRELPPRELQVLILYYHDELTLKEIGRVLDITESRISQLHGRALTKLRAKLFSQRKGAFEK